MRKARGARYACHFRPIRLKSWRDSLPLTLPLSNEYHREGGSIVPHVSVFAVKIHCEKKIICIQSRQSGGLLAPSARDFPAATILESQSDLASKLSLRPSYRVALLSHSAPLAISCLHNAPSLGC
jgi:hypothetical protein